MSRFLHEIKKKNAKDLLQLVDRGLNCFDLAGAQDPRTPQYIPKNNRLTLSYNIPQYIKSRYLAIGIVVRHHYNPHG